MTRIVCTPSGQPITAGLRFPKNWNKKPSLYHKLTYDQKDNGLLDFFRLEKTSNLNGLDKVEATCRNMGAICTNPFALFEYWRHLLTTGVVV